MTPINKRSIAKSIIFSIITFGMYYIFWKYMLVKNIRTITNDKKSCTGEMLLLTFVPFYSLYWWYTRGKTVKNSFENADIPVFKNNILYCILAFFGLEIVCVSLMQRDFNSLKCDCSYRNPKVFKRTCYGFCIFLTVVSIVLSASSWIHFGDSKGSTNADEISVLNLTDTFGDSLVNLVENMIYMPSLDQSMDAEETQAAFQAMKDDITVLSIAVYAPFVLIKIAVLLSMLFAIYGGARLLFFKLKTRFLNASMIIIFVVQAMLYLIFFIYNFVDISAATFVSGGAENMNLDLVFNEIIVIKPTIWMLFSTVASVSAYILTKYYQKNYIK